MEIEFDEATSLILLATSHSKTDALKTRRKILYEDLFAALITCDSFDEVAEVLDLTPDIVEKTMCRYMSKEFPDKPKNVKWGSYLLNIIGFKRCRECKKIQDLGSCFSKASNTWDSYAYVCKSCRALRKADFSSSNPEYSKQNYLKNKSAYIARAIKYKTKRKLATPPWADLDKIKEIYATCPEGFHVDHEIPLQGELVSGLHVETNLRHIPILDNLRKNNKFEIQ